MNDPKSRLLILAEEMSPVWRAGVDIYREWNEMRALVEIIEQETGYRWLIALLLQESPYWRNKLRASI